MGVLCRTLLRRFCLRRLAEALWRVHNTPNLASQKRSKCREGGYATKLERGERFYLIPAGDMFSTQVDTAPERQWMRSARRRSQIPFKPERSGGESLKSSGDRAGQKI